MTAVVSATASQVEPRLAARVLVVDDDADIRDLVAFKLGQAGHEVRVVEDGAAALSLAAQWLPDLIVLDIAMPGLSGYDVCKRLRQDPALAATRVIMLTARTQATFSTLGYMAGADLYLTKPFSPRELVDRVAAMLAGPRPGFGDELLRGSAPGSGEPKPKPKPARWWRR
jgi:two-component system, OmpR family, phosphate regulon response regulator PhoB